MPDLKEKGFAPFFGGVEWEVDQILFRLLNKILLRQLTNVISGVPAGSKISIKALQVFHSK